MLHENRPVVKSAITFTLAIIGALLLVVASTWLAINFRDKIAASHADAVMTASAWVVGVLGFSITVWQLRQTRTAAQSAMLAVNDVRRDLVQYDTFIELGKANTALNALVILHRQKKWGLLHDRYLSAKHALATVRDLHPGLSALAREALQDSIDQLTEMDMVVEHHLATTGSEPPDFGDLNIRVSGQIDSIHDIETALRKNIGKDSDG
jgi:hypothetical protein